MRAENVLQFKKILSSNNVFKKDLGEKCAQASLDLLAGLKLSDLAAIMDFIYLGQSEVNTGHSFKAYSGVSLDFRWKLQTLKIS